MKTFFKVINQGTPFGVTKQDGTTLNKCQIVLQEFGGKYENSYVCNLIGNSALLKFYPGDLVLAALTFKHNEYQGKFYQDINVQDIISFTNYRISNDRLHFYTSLERVNWLIMNDTKTP